MPTKNWTTREDFDDAADDPGFTHDEMGGHTTGGIQQGYEYGSLRRGLIAYYPMEQGQSNHLHDAARDNHGVINGATWTSGNIGSQALSFDGTDDDVVIDEQQAAQNSEFTIAIWFKTPGKSGGTDGYSEGTAGSTPFVIAELGNTDLSGNPARFRVHDGTDWTYLTTTTDVTDDSWHLFVGVRRSTSNHEVWLDGTKENSDTSTTVNTFTTSNQRIGSLSSSSQFFIGDISEVYIYDRSLSPAEVRALYNLTSPSGIVETEDPRDGLVSEWKLDGNANDALMQNHGTVNGATFETAYDGQGASFDGTDDYITVPSGFDFSNNGLTMMAWVNPETLDTNARTMLLVNSQDGGTGSRGGYIRLHDERNNGPRVGVYAGGWTEVGISPAASTGEWLHLAFVYDGSSCILYRNGVEAGRAAQSGDPSSGVDFTMAARSDGGQNLDGLIDEVRVYSRPLDPAEIERLFHLGQRRIDTQEMIY